MPASVAGSSYSGAPSVGSSTASSHQRLRAKAAENGREGDDLVEGRRSSIENGIFGVLFTLSKENNETHIRIRWVLLKIILDGWQLFTTCIQPAVQPWDINPKGAAWSVVGVLNFTWLEDLSYGVYLILLYSMVVLLAVNVVLCVWVAWCFKEQKFPVVWPIKVLRAFSSVFFHAFDVASLNLLQVGISCNFTGNNGPRLHMELFPTYSCSSTPHLAHAVVSGVSLVLFILIALLLNMAEVEVNPTSRRPMALGHSGAEVAAFGTKALMTMVGVFLGWPKVAACAYLALALLLAWQYLRWAPNLVRWVNYLKCGIAASIVYCSLMLVLLVFAPGVTAGGLEAYRRSMTLAMLGGLAPAFVLGAAWSWWWIRRTTNTALQAFKNMQPGVPLQDVHPFDEPRDVEVVARCCRVWRDRYTLDPEAVSQAHQVLKAGLALFPSSSYMALLHANFMIEVLGVSQSGQRQVEAARRLKPSLMARFMIFTRQQQATQKAAGSSTNDGASMDLLGYVEFQRKQRMVVSMHKNALQAMCNFWKALDARTVSFSTLSKALSKIESSVSQAQAAYRVVLEMYGNSPKLVRLYGKFLETIKNDPWGAAEYYAEAERLEEAKNDDARGPLLPDGTPLGRMDELTTSVLVINAVGEIQMANKQAHALFGYKRGTLDGKAMATLLAPHSGRALAEQVAALVAQSTGASGHGRPPGSATAAAAAAAGATGGGEPPLQAHGVALGMHHERVAFELKLSITKASGVGEDSTFIVMLEPLPVPKDTACLWVATNGTIACCDPNFVASFGFAPIEVIGTRLANLLAASGDGSGANPDSGGGGGEGPQDHGGSWQPLGAAAGGGPGALQPAKADILTKLLAAATAAQQDSRAVPTLPCAVLHKYDSAPLPCTAVIHSMGTPEQPVHEVRVRLSGGEPHLIMLATRKGVIKYASPELALQLSARGAGGGLGAGFGGARLGGSANGGADGAEGGGASGEGAMLPAGMAAAQLLAGFALTDFLPPFWKDTHTRLLKETTARTPASRDAWTCRKAAPGPTLELRTARGRPLLARVSVTTTEMGGEVVHMMRFGRSTVEAALDERRLRLTLAPDGSVSNVSKNTPPRLFGFKPAMLLGRLLWEVLEEPDQAAVRPGTSLGRAVTGLVNRALSSPGASWRVLVAPPVAAAQQRGLAADMAAMARANSKKAAVMHVSVVSPSESDDLLGAAPPTVYVDLWPVAALSAVLDVDASGRIAVVHEEATRPVGLLFGVPGSALEGEPLSAVLELPPGRSANDLLSLHGGPKKSNLKTKHKDVAVKVGPVHVLQGLHLDGKPLALDVQVSGKPGPGHPVTMLLRVHTAPLLPAPLPGAVAGPGGPASPAMRFGGSAGLGSAPAAAAPTDSPRAPSFLLAPGSGEGSSDATKNDLDSAMMPRLRTQDSTGRAAANGSPMLLPHAPDAGSPLKRVGSTAASATAAAAAAAAAAPPTHTPVEPITAPVPEALAGLLNAAKGLPAMPSATGRPAAARRRSPGSPGPVNNGDGEGDGAAAGEGGSVQGAAGGADGASPRVKRAPPSLARLDEHLDALESLMVSGTAEMADEDGAGAAPFGSAITAGVAATPKPTAGAHNDDEEDGDGVTDANSNKLSDDEDPSLNPVGKARISTWVATKGEYFQNTKSIGAEPEEDDDPVPDSRFGAKGAAVPKAAPAARGASPPGKTPAGGAAEKASGEKAAGGGGGAVPRPDDDAQSDGGYSAMSSQSGGGDAGGAEYKRGKRFRKLVKLMDSGQAQQVHQRFRQHALITVAVLAAVHIICFALTVHSVETKRASMLYLASSGDIQHYLQRILVDTRSLDQIYKNKSSANLYGPEDIDMLANRIYKDAVLIHENTNSIWKSYHKVDPKLMEVLFQTSIPAWAGRDEVGESRYRDLTLWDCIDRMFTMSKDLYQNYRQWRAQGVDISATDPGMFLLLSGPQLYENIDLITEELLHAAVIDTSHVNDLQLTFLAVEGCAISCLAAGYITYLLRAVAAQRYKLYGTFLSIPVGLTRALATQSTSLLDDDDDEDGDGDDDDDLNRGGGGGGGGDVAGGRGDDEGGQAAGKPRRRASIAVTSHAHGEGAARGDRHGPSKADNDTSNTDKALKPSMSAPSMDASGLGSWRARLGALFGVRSSSVLPVSGAAAAESSRKRALRYDSYQTLAMLVPFLMWSALVIIIYAIAVIKIQGVAEIVAVHGVVNLNSARTYRAVFYAQELAAEEDASLLRYRREELVVSKKLIEASFYTMLLGDDAYKTLGPDTERFPMVTAGLDIEDPDISRLLFDNRDCLRLPEHLPCPGPEYRYYEVTRVGVYSMMQQFISQLYALAENETLVPIGLEDVHFDFIYNVGTKDLSDGNQGIAEHHNHTIASVFDAILQLHIVLFLLLWVVFAGFVFILLNPLIKRVVKEKRRIAELMSQLPLELDVERLVRAALSGGQGAGGGGGGSGGAKGGLIAGMDGDGAGGENGDVKGAAKQWTQILRSASVLARKDN